MISEQRSEIIKNINRPGITGLDRIKMRHVAVFLESQDSIDEASEDEIIYPVEESDTDIV